MTPAFRLLVAAAVAFVGASVHGQILNESLSGSNATQPGASTTPTAEPAKPPGPLSWMIPKVTLPKIAMPKVKMPKMPADALAPVKASVGKMKAGSRKAWEGAKELLSFGRSKPDARVASSQQPSAVQRMFGGGDPAPQPQTMSEFISQPRPQ